MKRLLLILALALPLYGADYETTFEAEADPDLYSNFADSTDRACSGTASAKATSTSANMGDNAAATNTLYYWGGYLYAETLPGVASVISTSENSANTIRCSFELNSDGTIDASITGGTPVASVAAITAGAWYHLEFKCDTGQAAGSDIAEVRINGVVAATVTDGSTTAAMQQTRLRDAHATGATYWDDYYSYDTTNAYRGHSAGCGSLFGSDNKYKSAVIGE